MGGDIQVRTASKKPKHVGFLLMERFTLISLSSAIDPLRVANQLSGHTLYTWALVGSSPDTQVSSDGIRVALDAPLKSVDAFDIVIVVGAWISRTCPKRPSVNGLRNWRARMSFWVLFVPGLMCWPMRGCSMAINAVRTGIA